MTENLSELIQQMLQRHYDNMDSQHVIEISPASIAASVFNEIDPADISPTLVKYSSILHLRQLARAICRRKIEDDPSNQQQLFSGELQPRYPANRNGLEVYVIREHMSIAEYDENIRRLRGEANTKQAHADALEAEKYKRIEMGQFAESA